MPNKSGTFGMRGGFWGRESLRLVAAHNDARYQKSADRDRYPLLLIVGTVHRRIEEYFQAFKQSSEHACHSPIPPPRAYFATEEMIEKAADSDAHWFAPYPGKWCPLLDRASGVAGEPEVLWHRAPWPRLAPSAQVGLTVASGASMHRSLQGTIAQLALSLRPMDKIIVDKLGHHPLLAESDLTFWLNTSSRYVQRSLARLGGLQLIQSHLRPFRRKRRGEKEREPNVAYTLADLGVRYLAARDGAGRRIQPYVQARGWGFRRPSWQPRTHPGRQRRMDWASCSRCKSGSGNTRAGRTASFCNS